MNKVGLLKFRVFKTALGKTREQEETDCKRIVRGKLISLSRNRNAFQHFLLSRESDAGSLKWPGFLDCFPPLPV